MHIIFTEMWEVRWEWSRNQHCVQRRLDSLFLFAVGMCLKSTHVRVSFRAGGEGYFPPQRRPYTAT